MLAYFVFTFMSYKDHVQVSYYEVEEGSLVKEHNYTGLILREEEIVNAEANGYIYFYVADGKKAAKGSPVYSIDEGGQLMNYLNTHTDELSDLNSSKIADIRAEMLHYSRTFNSDDFRNLYNIKNTLDAHTIEYASMNIFSSITDELVNAGISFKGFNTDRTGVVCCYTDGYEDALEADIKETLFDQANYNKVNIKAGDLVSSGQPAYKMITSENWEIVFQMNEDDVAEFGNQNIIKLNFSDKGFSTKSKFKMITGTDGRQYGVVQLDSYMAQFTADRFIDFEIVTNDVSGLKIPVKSVTKKDFYTIPVKFLVTDEKDNKGFYKAVFGSNGTSAQFVIPEIFNIDDQFCYIDCTANSPLQVGDYVMLSPGADSSDFKAAEESVSSSENDEKENVKTEDSEAEDSGDENSSEESDAESADEASASEEEEADAESFLGTGSDAGKNNETTVDTAALTANASGNVYQIASRQSLEGVYNVNKGYTIFKKVDILETANGYSIIKKNASYGLQVYDHIVLDASTVHDGQILYR